MEVEPELLADLAQVARGEGKVLFGGPRLLLGQRGARGLVDEPLAHAVGAGEAGHPGLARDRREPAAWDPAESTNSPRPSAPPACSVTGPESGRDGKMGSARLARTVE